MNDSAKDLTLTQKVDAAFQQVAIRVIERARQTGTPVIVWENDQVSERTSDEMERHLGVGRRGATPPGGE